VNFFLVFFALATILSGAALLARAAVAANRRRRKARAAKADSVTLGRWSARDTDPAAFMAERIRKAASSDV